jgi:NTP pyrophosphatase (non-canonical NTP hydrolase)
MALAGEVGELAAVFQWLTPDESCRLDPEQHADATNELADVTIYLFRLAAVLSVDLAVAVQEKLTTNERRYPAEQVRGKATKSKNQG